MLRRLSSRHADSYLRRVDHPEARGVETDGVGLRERLQAALGGAYALERELGGGGMSRVFVAEDARLGRRIVVKVLHPDLAAGVSSQRFEREIRLAARLQHPHVVPVHTAGDVGGLPYYTMPFVEGESLRERLRREGALPVGDAARLVRELADALAYAHAQGVVHRDLKPENVLLSGGHAVVADFGVAKALASATQGGTPANGSTNATAVGLAVGTPAYMAPEQAAADPTADHRADLYALGVVAYELLAGAHPFAGRSAQAMLAAHLTEAPAPLASRRPDVPAALAALVTRLLAKEPAGRPQRAEEVVRALDAVVTPANGPAFPKPATRGRRPRIAAVVLGAALLLGVASAAFWARSRVGTTSDEGATDARTAAAGPLVAVLPFRVSAPAALDYLREGMLDLLAAKLTGEGGPRSVDPATLLAAWRRSAEDDRRDLPRDDALALARGLRAGGLVEGTVVGTPERLTLSAVLVTVPGGAERGRAEVTGPADSLPALVDRLAAQLLIAQAGARGSISGAATTSLSALRSYLDAQALVRRGRFVDATARFAAALEADSTFALAAIGAMEVSIFHGFQTPPPRLSRLAWAHQDRLSDRDRAYLVALVGGRRYPLPTPLPERLADWQRAVEVAPDRPGGWSRLGDIYWHYGATIGVEAFADRARASFERAVTLDPAYAPAFVHLIDMAALRQDSVAARRWIRAYSASDSSAHSLEGYRWVVATALADSAAVRLLRARMPEMPDGSLDRIALWTLQSGHAPRDAERALDLLSAREAAEPTPASGRGVYPPWRRAELLYNLGRPAAARAALLAGSAFSDLIRRSVVVSMAIASGADTAAAAIMARELAAAARAVPAGDRSGRTAQHASACYAALWQLSRGDTSTVAATMRRLRAADSTAVIAAAMPELEQCALILEAQLAVLRNSPDAIGAVERLDAAMRTHRHEWPDLLATLFLARTWEARGMPARALQAVRRREWNVVFVAAAQWREEGRLAALTGDRESAIRAYEAYLGLHYAPEPELLSEVAGVRAELARLRNGNR